MDRTHFIQDVFQNLKSGTDKFQHGYTPVYASLPAGIQSILEIGVDKGYSLLAWSRIFPQAQILGVDTDPKIVNPEIRTNQRIAVIKSDIRDYYPAGYFDVIIDDGLHTLELILAAWYKLKDRFRVAYIIEDVQVELFHDLYVHLTTEMPKAQVIFWRTSDYKGDVMFQNSDSHCFVVLKEGL